MDVERVPPPHVAARAGRVRAGASRKLRAAALVAAALCAALAAACGDGGARFDALDRAADGAESAGPFRARLAMRADFQGQRVSFRGELASAADGSRTRVTGELAQQGQEPFELTALGIGGTEWVRSSQLELPRGRTWARIDGGRSAPSTLPPADVAQFLISAGDVREVGDEVVRGRKATHYSGRVAPGELDEDDAGRLAAVTGPGVTDVTLHVWLGPDDLPLRTQIDVRPPRGVAGGVRLRTDVLEYGVSLAGVEPPPARLVAAPQGG